jgi:hypothetical protein
MNNFVLNDLDMLKINGMMNCTCAVCDQQFFTDCPEVPLCADCETHGWTFIAADMMDARDCVFNPHDVNPNEIPF